MGVEVYDNFLSSYHFDIIQSFFMGDRVPWFWKDTVVYDNERGDDYQFNTSILAKNKTLIQVLCMHMILVILIVDRFSIFTISYSFIYYIMFFCTFMTLLSGFDYMFKYYLRNSDV